MLLHTVLFWLNDGISEADRQRFEAGVQSLTRIESVRFGFVGVPAATRRPVIDSSYAYKLVVGFDNLAGHDTYQTAEIHLQFLANCKTLWQRVLIYDATDSGEI